MPKSTKREVVKLVSTAGTGYYYTAKIKKDNEKLRIKKYDPKIRKHVEFKQTKLTK